MKKAAKDKTKLQGKSQALEAGKEIFIWNKDTKIIAWMAMVLGSANAVSLTIVAMNRGSWILGPLVGGLCALLAYYGLGLFLLRSYRIEVDQESFTEKRPGYETMLAWKDLEAVKMSRWG